MIKYFISKILEIFDYFHKKKIVKALKFLNFYNLSTFIDIGAHKGESIDFFTKYFKIKNVYSFEANPQNFIDLKNKYKNNKNFIIENIALSSCISEKFFNQCQETSSSTFSNINYNSVYLKKKIRLFGSFKKKNFFKKIKINTDTLDNYLIKNNIKKICLLKIDTEGHEYEILKGLSKNIKIVKAIIFEHHYDNMLNKNYTFSEIHTFLLSNLFHKVAKLKMPFRKSFEYIYINGNQN